MAHMLVSNVGAQFGLNAALTPKRPSHGTRMVTRARLSDWFGGENYMASKIGNKVDLDTRNESGSKGTGEIVQCTFVGAGGIEVTIDCPDDRYILDIAIDNGVELPFSCRGGVCGACVGRVTAGQVDQSDVDDLEFCIDEDEQADGMALLCMARPVGDVRIETQSDWGYSLGTKEWKGATGYITGKDPVGLGVNEDSTYNPTL
mmetsp:Transcript_14761/g.28412  ORF Transcript_14761/g.28412 Transcript_14761/m.28412 type:complete len:203 (-) Transcript_14761:144-752(-)|eukprot:CAMPEP_0114253216 /NCGR_PEP_ID=MMETSP0058-20121206/16267_1 /TAXON_ID=36894 /ORGANISM="Pyramimonas parkeae, CCMP726" /LENGTH=202 /DNA_ID=CAMNT_0001367233 /DNA_START=158 /DNA_END=766 /DNA_ORIENTATION=-